MKANSYLDTEILKSEVSTIIEFPDKTKQEVIFKCTDKMNGYYLTQIKTINIKKNGQKGLLTNWIKFKHYVA